LTAVTAAYGLTAEDVRLMWNTALPRMPFTPHGPGADEAMDVEDDDEE
jgi:hypothetical protein